MPNEKLYCPIMEHEYASFEEKSILVGQVFNPNTPVSERDLFSGRTEQIRRVLDVIFQKGQHAIIFGERGVGKTSLANVLKDFFPPSTGQAICIRINCDRNDSFRTVWNKVFDEMQITGSKMAPGFKPEAKPVGYGSSHFLPNHDVTPSDVRRALSQLAQHMMPVVIIDEFDRLTDRVRKLFADLIKGLSDYAVAATVVLIGVGDSVEQIISEHESVARSLVQIQMPRMSQNEIKNIITNGLSRLGMTIDEKALTEIAELSKGLPHYTHLVGMHAAREALSGLTLNITDAHLTSAITKAILDAQHSIRANYHKAIRSARKDNLFADVLLACALAQVNEMGEFAAQNLRTPMHAITGKAYDIPAYAQHLNEFSDDKRGRILIKTGEAALCYNAGDD